MDRIAVGNIGEQAQSPVLLDHETGTETTCGRDGELGADLRRDRPCFAFGGAETAMTSWIFRLASRARGLFGQKKADSEFDQETQTHLQLLTEKFIRQGMDPNDAYSAARRQFGNPTLLRQRHRESRTLLALPNLFHDLRYSLRMLRKNPTFSVIAALTLALGIGATSAVFTLIQGVLLTPPPYQKPQQLMLIPSARTDGKEMDNPRGWAAQQWMEWNEK